MLAAMFTAMTCALANLFLSFYSEMKDCYWRQRYQKLAKKHEQLLLRMEEFQSRRELSDLAI